MPQGLSVSQAEAPWGLPAQSSLHLPHGAVEFLGGFAVRQNRQQKTLSFEH